MFCTSIGQHKQKVEDTGGSVVLLQRIRVHSVDWHESSQPCATPALGGPMSFTQFNGSKAYTW